MNQCIELLQIWLKKNGLDSDLHIYTQEEWKVRKEEYHEDADYVITTEGGLWRILNFGDEFDLVEQFMDLLESFNYYHEMGASWNMGLYRIEDVPVAFPQNISYAQKLQNPLWQRKRTWVLKRAGHKCEDCGTNQTRLDVHHCYYMYGLEPWQYPYDALRVLCPECHVNRAAVEKVFRANLQIFTQSEIESLHEALSIVPENYGRKEFFELMQAIGTSYADVPEAFARFYASRVKHI